MPAPRNPGARILDDAVRRAAAWSPKGRREGGTIGHGRARGAGSSSGAVGITVAVVEQMSVAELRAELRQRGLYCFGVRRALVERLVGFEVAA